MIFNTHNILFGIYLLYILFYKQPYSYYYHGFKKKKTGISLFLIPPCDYTHKNNSEI